MVPLMSILKLGAIVNDMTENILAQDTIMQSSSPLIFLRHAFARPELSGYKVSSKSAEQSHLIVIYIYNMHEYEIFNLVLGKCSNYNTYQTEGSHIFVSELFVSSSPRTPFFYKKPLHIER